MRDGFNIRNSNQVINRHPHPCSVVNELLPVDFIQPRELDVVPFHISDFGPKLLVLPSQSFEDGICAWTGAKAG